MQALSLAMEAYPRVGSRLTCHEGVPKFHLEAGEVAVSVVTVDPAVLSSKCKRKWLQVFETVMPPRVVGLGPDATPLFEACLIVSHDMSAGCVLVAGFQHVLGDAGSYSFFMRKWYIQDTRQPTRKIIIDF